MKNGTEQDGRNARYGKSRHEENYRVVADSYWPRDANTTHNARYYEHYDQARMAYMHLVMDQMMESRLLERVTFECRNRDGKYYPMFESYQNHTVESYG